MPVPDSCYPPVAYSEIMESRPKSPDSNGTVASGGRARAGAGTWRRVVFGGARRGAGGREDLPSSLRCATDRILLRRWRGQHRRAAPASLLQGRGTTWGTRRPLPANRTVPGLPATARVFHARAMFVVTEADAAAIRAAFHEEGELSAVVELRRRFPGITDPAKARECARTIAGWKLLPAAPCPVTQLHPGKSR